MASAGVSTQWKSLRYSSFLVFDASLGGHTRPTLCWMRWRVALPCGPSTAMLCLQCIGVLVHVGALVDALLHCCILVHAGARYVRGQAFNGEGQVKCAEEVKAETRGKDAGGGSLVTAAGNGGQRAGDDASGRCNTGRAAPNYTSCRTKTIAKRNNKRKCAPPAVHPLSDPATQPHARSR
jgi:hypothetical protein